MSDFSASESDFFGDDFTKDLKKFYLDNIITDIDKYIVLIKDSNLKLYQEEIKEKIEDWQRDAQTNEFNLFAKWLSLFAIKIESCKKAEEFKFLIHRLHLYLDDLLVALTDSEEMFKKHTLENHSRKELYLYCRHGIQEFLLPIENVLEVISKAKVSPLPDYHFGISGVLAVRGEIFPVYNLIEFGFQEIEEKVVYYVICDYQGARFAVPVTQTDQLLTVDSKEMQQADSRRDFITAHFISSFIIKDKKSVMVFDLEKLVA